MKKLIYLLTACTLIYACSPRSNSNQNDSSTSSSNSSAISNDPSAYDAKRGEGKFDKMDLPNMLDQQMASAGETIANVKCASCHKYSEEKLVGPGWSGVTTKHQPQWIMNFITNPDPMIDKDPELQAQLEICLVRMPNQNLSDEEARQILEFMRKNDGLK